MKRREFITLLGGAGAAWPLAARGQQRSHQHPLVGYLITGTKDGLAPDVSAFLNRLRELGYVEGQNIEIATRYADTDTARLPASIRRRPLLPERQLHPSRLWPPY